MTKWQEFPLRPQGRAWPGSNTRAGRLDDGSGLMTDTSTNVMINRGDTLEKRKGLVRGLDERFEGTVCGLHRYTDECGVEHLLVADEESIKIRQPFDVPVFENSDAYPVDSFQGTGLPDQTRWRNFGSYVRVSGALQVVAESDPMVWFKEASNVSYQLRTEWIFQEVATDQRIRLILKAADITATNARIEGELFREGATGTVMLICRLVDANGAETVLIEQTIDGPVRGFLNVTYTRATRVVKVEVFPQLASQVIEESDPITVVQDADLGQFSAVQLVGATTNVRILFIDGGPV